MTAPGVPGPRPAATPAGGESARPGDPRRPPPAPPPTPAALLAAVAEVFTADIAAVVRRVGERLLLVAALGLADDDPGYTEGWLLPGPAVRALRTGQAVNWVGAADEPPGAAPPVVGAVAWVPLAAGAGVAPGTEPGVASGSWPGSCGPIGAGPSGLPVEPVNRQVETSPVEGEHLLVLVRRCRTAFTGAELRVLRSVAAAPTDTASTDTAPIVSAPMESTPMLRTPVAADPGERPSDARLAGIEQLARYGHQLARHLEPGPLLEEAAGMFGQLVEAAQVWLVTPDHAGGFRLRAHRGLSERDLAGWPGHEHWRPATVGHSGLLRVPVRHGGALTAVLFAARPSPAGFPDGTAELAAIFADHLSVAIANTGHYGALWQRASQDPLTGLANRTVVTDRLDRLLTARAPAQVGLLFCDLDRFKAVNDLLGHEAGDELLQQVAERLKGTVRAGDLLARFGGDEFVIVVDVVGGVAELAECGWRVSRALDREFTLRAERVRVSASVGGVLGVPGRTSAGIMLRNADAALYVAKDRGLGQVEVFEESSPHGPLDRLDLRAELDHALERDQLHLRYQPIVSMTDGRVAAFEVTPRWHHPRHGWVPQEVLVPLAEDTGSMDRIGGWMLSQACRQLTAWRGLPGGGDLAVSFNLATSQLRPADAVAGLLAVIRDAGADPGQVWLELDQHRLRCEELAARAAELHAAGVHFALEGFGTAYTSLRFLQRFPIDILKLDLGVADDVTGWEVDPGIVRATLAIAESLGLTVVGDGVRTGSQRAALRQLGCQLGQGQLVSPPLSSGEATAFLSTTGAGPRPLSR